jgi:glutamate-1-semialdehyde 2,1-aminomutase
VAPDLSCLGKVIGGGLPLAAYGGRRDLMQLLAPVGGCYQAGTLSGNPVAVAAGLATLGLARAASFYPRQAARLTRLLSALGAAARRHQVALQLSQAGTMWGFCFSERPVRTLADVQASDLARWRGFTLAMLRRGVYLAPSPFEAAFWSSAHGEAEIRHTLAAAEQAFALIA